MASLLFWLGITAATWGLWSAAALAWFGAAVCVLLWVVLGPRRFPLL